MKIDLQKIENTLKDFFEKDLRIVAHKNPLQSITDEMISAMEKNLKTVGNKIFAPNVFRVSIRDKKLMDDDDMKDWKKYAQDIIREIARDNAFQLAGPLHIQVFFNPKLEQDFEIAVSNSSIPSGKTVNLYSEMNGVEQPEATRSGYLITADENYHPIIKLITTIGRREDNDLVIDNLRVSRVHAQIRQIKQKHVLFDLDSTSGTKVNGVKIHQHTLNHGDVIEIADVPIIYGTDQDDVPVEENKNKTRAFSINKGAKTKK
jgi:hypothetical protein